MSDPRERVLYHVSIHAPARGATCGALTPTLSASSFQSTRPRGARHVAAINSIFQALFQSTRPRGARHAIAIPSAPKRSFQSTRPRGARHRNRQLTGYCRNVSIHAPARGATRPNAGRADADRFQSTRPRGARRDEIARLRRICAFQSTRPRGARLIGELCRYR